MPKPSRNAPCACGSGKKYKRCHGLAFRPPIKAKEGTSSAVGQKQSMLKVNVRRLGLPGQAIHLTSVNKWKDPNDPRNKAEPRGGPGKYQVIFTLQRPGFPLFGEGQ